MQNRTAAVIITLVVILLCACPGFAFLCNGLLALLEIITNYQVQIVGYGYNAPYWVAASFCIGLLGIIVSVIVAVFVLRQKKTTPPPPPPPAADEPLPPTI